MMPLGSLSQASMEITSAASTKEIEQHLEPADRYSWGYPSIVASEIYSNNKIDLMANQVCNWMWLV